VTRDAHDWNELAQLDPLWAVLADPRKKKNGWTLEEFLATGEAEVSAALARTAALGVDVTFDRALDIGCGVGRITRALADRFHECVGIDVAQTMIQHAARINVDRRNCLFRCADAAELEWLNAGRFNLVWSVLTLQHLRAKDIERVIGSLRSVLEIGGVAIFQLPYSMRPVNRLQLSRRFYSGLRFTGASRDVLLQYSPLTPMRMTPVREQRVRELLRFGGCELLGVEPYGDQRLPTPSRLYVARRGD
jgi:SAM-dependent methyltransferase